MNSRDSENRRMYPSNVSDKRTSIRITIQGIVQGVGFRPFIYNLAGKIGISGTVKNTSAGVIIDAIGTPEKLDEFFASIQFYSPPLSRIDSINRVPVKPADFNGFEILDSEILPGAFSLVPPDIATCPDCLRELNDPIDRRYRYPFINCTNCGPRFSIIRKMPYDRPFTSMQGFPLCKDCQAEYEDPTNRRFHAQPIACPICGPQITFYQKGLRKSNGEDALQKARSLILAGGILALKGLGGFQLVCDAINTDAVSRLRRSKLRSEKPFALMSYDLAKINKFCYLTNDDEIILVSPQHPILILRAKSTTLQHIAPGQQTLGFMLPNTPLHYLLTEPTDGFPETLVVTSGNISDEPMLIDDETAIDKFANIADGILGHNRPILNRVDDSVYKPVGSYVMPMRRSRGYAPDPILITEEIPQVFASGALLKNTFSIVIGKQVFTSHYIGDLDNLETYKDYELSVHQYFELFQFSPEVIACDSHPDFLSTHYGEKLANKLDIPIIYIQHHHAHLAACLAENKLPLDEEVIALCYDGTGYGEDDAIWGGEILSGNATEYKRRFHLQYMPLPGGDMAIKKPYRIALAYLHSFGIPFADQLAPVNYCTSMEQKIICDQVDRNINTIQTSSMGRLFDAVSALIGIRQEVSYEGQAAIEMEALANLSETGVYNYSINVGIVALQPLLLDIVNDLSQKVPTEIISARFHNTIVKFSLECIMDIIDTSGSRLVALSGGVWQNCFLQNKMVEKLKNAGINPLLHTKLPPNDSCISLGQAVIAGSRMKRK